MNNPSAIPSRFHVVTLVLSGLLTVVGALLHPDEKAHPETVLTAVWMIAHALFLASMALALLGLPGVYARMARAGRIGVALGSLGLTLLVPLFVIEAFVLPTLASDPAGLKLIEAAFNGPLGLMALTASICVSVGFVLLGVVIVRQGVMPRWVALFLIVGAPLASLSDMLPHLIAMAGIALMGIGLGALGATLSGARTMSETRMATATAR